MDLSFGQPGKELGIQFHPARCTACHLKPTDLRTGILHDSDRGLNGGLVIRILNTCPGDGERLAERLHARTTPRHTAICIEVIESDPAFVEGSQGAIKGLYISHGSSR